ncbi:MAG: translation initiation factor IF-2 [Clostridia bacterium]|nr:translation initiation factor IF-2 [Clostridia bacterium]
MGKKKVYELAKELDINSKELISIAKKLGIELKSHLSTLEDNDVEKIKNSANKKENTKPPKKEKEDIKTTGQVIIRRKVIVDEEDIKKQEQPKSSKEGIGFTERRNKDFNIVYREKPTRPMTVSELFGIKPKNNKKEVEKPKVEKKVEEKPNTEAVKEVKTEEKTKATKVENEVKTQKQVKTEFNRNNNNFQNGYQRGNNYNNRNNNNIRNNNNNNFNRNNNVNFNRNRNNNNNNNSSFNNRDSFNNRTGFNSNRRLQNRQNEEPITTEFLEKENQRDYTSKFIDKQKANRNFEEKKKNTKSRRFSQNDNFSEDRLRDLKQVKNLSNMFGDQEGGMLDYYDLSNNKGNRRRKTKKNSSSTKQQIFELKEITIPENISVKDLATELKKTSADVLKKLMELGIMANLNQELDFDTSYLVADSFGVTANKKEVISDEDILFDDSEDKEEDLEKRPPVVVVMGHVDHGKTSLLDAIRNTNVIEGEAGGITQHIGAYKVKVNDREITFLDTPGHEAFTSMRARGAQITDIAILIVAADDGVMPQTIEAINHAKAAEIPIIVAINKIDLPGANVEKVKQELMKYELVPEEWGGDTIFVPISARQNINIDNLLEMVLLQADILELKANPNRQSKGTVIEARLDRTQGPVAALLVQRGTLNVGDTIIVGSSIGRIRTMTNDKGKNVKVAGPSTPVRVTGLKTLPEAGDTFYEVKNEKVAKHLIEQRKLENREKTIANDNLVTLDNLFQKLESEGLKQLNIIVKTDVQGTAEALKTSLEKLSNEEVRVKVLHATAGGVTETDIDLAKAANAIVIAFNVRPVGAAQKKAELEQVEIKQYSIIYQVLEDVEDAMKGMLEPEYREVNIGNAEVRQTFKVSNVGTIAGCYVIDGKVERNAGVRVIREGVVIHDGKLVSLKRFKDDAKEVSKGFECGMQIEDYDDIKVGDTIEAYIQEEIKR